MAETNKDPIREVREDHYAAKRAAFLEHLAISSSVKESMAIGEQGPELFVPMAAGRIEPYGSPAVAPNVRLTINISDNGQGSAPDQIRRSSRQVARAVRNALAYREG